MHRKNVRASQTGAEHDLHRQMQQRREAIKRVQNHNAVRLQHHNRRGESRSLYSQSRVPANISAQIMGTIIEPRTLFASKKKLDSSLLEKSFRSHRP
jgi:hypothetical protein